MALHSRCDHSGSPVCSKCGKVVPFPLSPPDYFSIFELAPTLKSDLAALTERFYALSLQIHPDKFSGQDSEEQRSATQWTTLLNRAYQTLKSAEARSRYFLELQGKPAAAKSAVPLDLAETYFEIQEAIEEGASPEKLKAFDAELSGIQAAAEQEFETIAVELGRDPKSAGGLKALADYLDKKRYLQSMREDLSKKVGI